MLLDSYEKIDTYLRNGDNPNDRPTPEKKNNTRIVRINDNIVGIKFHNTVIMVYHKNGNINLYSNQWFTRTTRDRINRWQKKFEVIINRKLKWFINYQGMYYPFQEGITLQPNGVVVTKGGIITPLKTID